MKENRRVLVGFDFPYGYPCGSSRALGLPFGRQPWWEIWTQLAARVQDAANNVNNRFVVAAVASNLLPVICINKWDLADGDSLLSRCVIYQQSFRVLFCSAILPKV